jgi:hypothetical protein
LCFSAPKYQGFFEELEDSKTKHEDISITQKEI